MAQSFYCKGDNSYHYVNEIPSNLKPFYNYTFSSGGVAGSDFTSFNTKFRNAIKKLLPEGCSVHKWNKGHYYCSAVIKRSDNSFVYISIGDVRYWPNEWVGDILIRTMENDHDWTGGPNHKTTLFTIGKDILKIGG